MILTQFKYLLQPGQVLDSPARSVNINYNLVGANYRVEAVAVRITVDNLLQLQNATKITLTIPGAGVSIGIPLQSSLLPIRTVNREQVGNYYLYNIIELDQQPVIAAPSPSGTPALEDYNTDVIIEPSIANSNFIGSDYDALLNNTAGDRQSEYIQISDRVQSKLAPQNLPSILLDKAIPASVQDSNYTNTGWVKGRYDGTKTDSTQYGGIEPALLGGATKGAFFPQTYTEDQIRNIPPTDITYQDYFFTGKLDAPTCEILTTADISATLDTAIAAQTTTLIILATYSTLKGRLQQGDLIGLDSSTYTVGGTEICKILSVSSIPYPNAYQLEVVRGFGGSIPRAHTSSPTTNIYKIASNQFYLLQSNKIQGLLAGKLLIQDSQEVVYLNAIGYSTSGSKA
jgi:hypothetical protein